MSVPLQFAFQPAPEIAVFLDSGIFAPVSHFGDDYVVPVGIGGDFLATHGLDVGIEFMLRSALAGSSIHSEEKGINDRTLMLYVAFRDT